jgi:uncharacterized protein YjbI with pentapeptide repeats
MFVPRPCATRGCGRPALSGADVCIVHHPAPSEHVRSLLKSAQGPLVLWDMDLAGARIEDVDLSGVEMHGCRLTAATLIRVKLAGAQIHLSFLDRATFEACDATGATLQNAVFAGSELAGCSFVECEIIQSNFLGIRALRTRFDHSNLYGSRFIGSLLEEVSMRDCSLMRTIFDVDHRTSVDFKSSNTNEALFLEQAP